MLCFGPLPFLFDFRCPRASITAVIANSFWTIMLVFCCSCDLLLLAAGHEWMENAEVALFDIAGMAELTS